MERSFFLSLQSLFFFFFFFFFFVVVISCPPTLALSSKDGGTTGNYTISDTISLLSFKSLISQDPHGALDSWESSSHRSDFCTAWLGVTCARGRVTALNLSSLNLTGTISPFIANLTFLRFLDLSDNNFHGSIPHELGSLSQLQHLVLSFNSIEGSIPAALSHCSQLRNISLRSNRLSGRIPSTLGFLSSLTVLKLSDNLLEAEEPEDWEFLTSLSNCSQLRVVHLWNNLLGGKLPGSVGNLSTTQLVYLAMDQNRISGAIPPDIGKLVGLNTLFLSDNLLSGPIPDAIGHLRQLQLLSLAGNNISGTIPPSLWNLSSLVNLSLSENQLTGALPQDLGHTLPNLSWLLLDQNQFHGPIPVSLSNASSLELIQLFKNLFSGTIPQSLGNLQSLFGLILFEDRLEARTAADWGFLTSLSNCTSLQFLDLRSNKLAGKMPQSVANLSAVSLEFFTMKSNRISGSIPAGIGNLVSLSVLDFSANLLTGAIPTTVGKLQKLQRFYLGDNRLFGEIPYTVGNLTQLNELYLHSNLMTGSIPTTLANCKHLEALYLWNNHLTGNIPKEVLTISSLTIYLSLGSNSLTGMLPAEVGRLVNLANLDLSDNRLSGEIPRTIGACQVLRFLHLEGNQFSGTIPSSFSQGLEVLDLSHNNLSGNIPKSLASIRSLTMLNLSFNVLDGEVPNEGVFLNSTAVSLLGNSKLCSGNLKLDLSPCTKEINTRKHWSSRTLIISSVGSSLCLMAIIIWLAFVRFHKHKSRRKDPSDIQELIENKHTRVSYTELFKATDGFSSANLIGQGSFGSVYKGTMTYDSQNVVAVKVLNLQQRGASRSFIAECETLRNIRHRNLVKILTSCSSTDLQGNDFKALIFEYFPNGSLEKWLHHRGSDEMNQERLSLIQRLNIAIDVASALDYLHQEGCMAIVHCDLKPSNVLLDNDMIAHVGDFGLARFLTENASRSSQKSTSSIILKGSIGYVAPEYGMGNEISTQGDVYSYGIVLLELFTRKRPTDDTFKEGLNLHRFVEMAFPEKLMRIVDPCLLIEKVDGKVYILPHDTSVRDKNLKYVAKVLQIGLMCSNESPMERMHIRDAIKGMQEIRDVYQRDNTQASSKTSSSSN